MAGLIRGGVQSCHTKYLRTVKEAPPLDAGNPPMHL